MSRTTQTARALGAQLEALLSARRPMPLTQRRNDWDNAAAAVGRLAHEARDEASVRRKEYSNRVNMAMHQRRQRDASIAQANAAASEVASLHAAAASAASSACFTRNGPSLTLLFRSTSATCESVAYEQTLQIWDWSAQRRIRSMPEIVSEATFIAVVKSSDGASMASGCADGSVNLYDATTAGLTCRLHCKHHIEPILCVAFSPDGTRLATGGLTGLILIWDLASGECQERWIAHTGYVLALAFSPDGDLLATGGQDCTVAIWSTAKKQPLSHQSSALSTLSGALSDSSSVHVSNSETGTCSDVSSERSMALLDTKPLNASTLPVGRLHGGRSCKKLLSRLVDLHGSVLALRFNCDGQRLYTGLHVGHVDVLRQG